MNAVRSVTLNMLMLQLGMSTTACTRSRLGSPWGERVQVSSHGAYRPGGLQLIRECGNKCRQACYLLLSHYPPLLRARRENIPSCSGVTGTMEGGVSGHGAYSPGGSPTPCERGEAILSPFRWLDVVLSPPTHHNNTTHILFDTFHC